MSKVNSGPSVLDNHKLYYEDMPARKLIPRKGGKDSKMSKSVKQEVPTASKAAYAPSRMEVFKTVVIAVLITAIIAFVGGMHFANQHNAEVTHAAASAITAPAVAKK